MGGWEGEFLVSRFMEPLHVAETTIPKVLSADYRPPLAGRRAPWEL